MRSRCFFHRMKQAILAQIQKISLFKFTACGWPEPGNCRFFTWFSSLVSWGWSQQTSCWWTWKMLSMKKKDLRPGAIAFINDSSCRLRHRTHRTKESKESSNAVTCILCLCGNLTFPCLTRPSANLPPSPAGFPWCIARPRVHIAICGMLGWFPGWFAPWMWWQQLEQGWLWSSSPCSSRRTMVWILDTWIYVGNTWNSCPKNMFDVSVQHYALPTDILVHSLGSVKSFQSHGRGVNWVWDFVEKARP